MVLGTEYESFLHSSNAYIFFNKCFFFFYLLLCVKQELDEGRSIPH